MYPGSKGAFDKICSYMKSCDTTRYILSVSILDHLGEYCVVNGDE